MGIFHKPALTIWASRELNISLMLEQSQVTTVLFKTDLFYISCDASSSKLDSSCSLFSITVFKQGIGMGRSQ